MIATEFVELAYASAFEAKPERKGTRKLVELYGSRLGCVRYRYDEARQKRIKTVELIVEELDWAPKPKQTRPTTLVDLRIAYGEAELARRVKTAGGKWNAAKRLWELRYDQTVALGLTERIVPKVSNTTNPKAQTRLAKASNTRNPKASSI